MKDKISTFVVVALVVPFFILSSCRGGGGGDGDNKGPDSSGDGLFKRLDGGSLVEVGLPFKAFSLYVFCIARCFC